MVHQIKDRDVQSRAIIRRVVSTGGIEHHYGLIDNPITPADEDFNRARVLYLIDPDVDLRVPPELTVDIPTTCFHFKVWPVVLLTAPTHALIIFELAHRL